MDPCVVVERLEGKQRCSRAAVSEHAGIQARKWSIWLFTKKREVNEKNDQTLNSPHTNTTAQRTDNIPLICTGVGLIHPVHSQPMSLATEAMPRNEVTFLPFSRGFFFCSSPSDLFNSKRFTNSHEERLYPNPLGVNVSEVFLHTIGVSESPWLFRRPLPCSVPCHWAPCAFTGPARDTPTIPLVPLCIHRDALAIPLRSLCFYRDAPSDKPLIKMPPSTFPPRPGFYVCILHILQETARLSVCAQVQGSILRNFCRLVAYLCRFVSLRQYAGRGLLT